MSFPTYPGACSMDEPFFTTSYRINDSGQTKRFAIKRTEVDVTSTGHAARIASANNLNITANYLDNSGSNILANRDISLKVSSSTTKATRRVLRLNILSTRHQPLMPVV